jgi:hypothetical protein
VIDALGMVILVVGNTGSVQIRAVCMYDTALAETRLVLPIPSDPHPDALYIDRKNNVLIAIGAHAVRDCGSVVEVHVRVISFRTAPETRFHPLLCCAFA